MSFPSQQASPSPSGYDLNLNALAEYSTAPPELSKQEPRNFSEMGICYKASNNKYPDCPALMEDGRAFTDYRPSCYINDLIRVMNGIHSSYSYRQFLQQNALELMDTIRLYNIKKNGCSPCNAVPVQCETLCSVDNQAVSCSPYDCQNGIGRCYQSNPRRPLPSANRISNLKSWCDLKQYHR
jgi:hypothetical protein